MKHTESADLDGRPIFIFHTRQRDLSTQHTLKKQSIGEPAGQGMDERNTNRTQTNKQNNKTHKAEDAVDISPCLLGHAVGRG